MYVYIRHRALVARCGVSDAHCFVVSLFCCFIIGTPPWQPHSFWQLFRSFLQLHAWIFFHSFFDHFVTSFFNPFEADFRPNLEPNLALKSSQNRAKMASKMKSQQMMKK